MTALAAAGRRAAARSRAAEEVAERAGALGAPPAVQAGATMNAGLQGPFHAHAEHAPPRCGASGGAVGEPSAVGASAPPSLVPAPMPASLSVIPSPSDARGGALLEDGERAPRQHQHASYRQTMPQQRSSPPLSQHSRPPLPPGLPRPPGSSSPPSRRARRPVPDWGSATAKAALAALVDVDSRYTPLKQIGTGAYGVVVAARDELSGDRVAVKKVSNVFSNAIDARRTLREMALMRHLRHDNVAPLRDVLCTGDDVFLVYELMDTDLHRILRSSQPLSDDHVSFFLYQVLRALKYVHSADVMHRDIKPSNLLVNANCDLCICDFGLARAGATPPDGEEGRELFFTEYVVTRWYRAPELLLSCPSYSQAVDMWSVGCVLAELLGRRPLFPGRDYINQLNLQLRVLGTPSNEDLKHVTNAHALRYVRSMADMPGISLASLYPKANPLAIDLLEKMLVFVPEKRISVKEALEHPYLAQLHDVMDEPTYANTFSQHALPTTGPCAAAGQQQATLPISPAQAPLTPVSMRSPGRATKQAEATPMATTPMDTGFPAGPRQPQQQPPQRSISTPCAGRWPFWDACGDGQECAGAGCQRPSAADPRHADVAASWAGVSHSQEPCSGRPVIKLPCDDDVPTVEDVRDRVVQEMLRFHPEFGDELANIAADRTPQVPPPTPVMLGAPPIARRQEQRRRIHLQQPGKHGDEGAAGVLMQLTPTGR